MTEVAGHAATDDDAIRVLIGHGSWHCAGRDLAPRHATSSSGRRAEAERRPARRASVLPHAAATQRNYFELLNLESEIFESSSLEELSELQSVANKHQVIWDMKTIDCRYSVDSIGASPLQ
ncbi:hypothetical protein E2C01_093578 [Portunus trituberculatus]|uniref:Uncharacterized protein n=1 Tax=Portunus trituberculatus TaxID=210409 RepID=A0A5B7JN33_PORTR|nr:hypothetical protein [Portunus trituberculatus]